jgi:uracil-DNA glycosylase family 4
MTDRREMLEELGLGPRWVRRDLAQEASASPEAEAPEVVRPIDSPRETPPRAPVSRTPVREVPVAAPVVPSERAEAILRMDWPELEQAVAACEACALAARRNKTVFGVGDRAADWLFVGEGPGADEDAKGEPFVGQAGKLLDNMLAAIGLRRGENVFIANVVKCRPPGNRNPEPPEAASCMPFLQRQVDLIRPRLIVALGKVAAANLLGSDEPIARLRGRVLEYRTVPLIVTYHPAYLLRNLPEKAKVWEDLCFARDTMAGFVQSSGQI